MIDVPDRRPNLPKREIVDLLDVHDRDGISLFGAAPVTSGSATRSTSRTQTVEAVLPLVRQRTAFVNDTNFGSTGRNPNLPDYSDFIVLRVPGIRG